MKKRSIARRMLTPAEMKEFKRLMETPNGPAMLVKGIKDLAQKQMKKAGKAD